MSEGGKGMKTGTIEAPVLMFELTVVATVVTLALVSRLFGFGFCCKSKALRNTCCAFWSTLFLGLLAFQYVWNFSACAILLVPVVLLSCVAIICVRAIVPDARNPKGDLCESTLKIFSLALAAFWGYAGFVPGLKRDLVEVFGVPDDGGSDHFHVGLRAFQTNLRVSWRQYKIHDQDEEPRWQPTDHPELRCCRPITTLTGPIDTLKWSNELDVKILRHPDDSPPSPDDPRPTIIYIHGGGWTGGGNANVVDLLSVGGILQPGGPAIVSLNYRLLSFGYTFEYQLDDIEAGIEWVVKNGPSLGLRTDRMILAGMSAGGHLAVLSMLRFTAEKYPQIIGVVNVFGVVEPSVLMEGPWLQELGTAYAMDMDAETEEERIAMTGAQYWLEDTRRPKKLPPVLTIHGRMDWLISVEMARTLHRRLDELGSPNVYVEMPLSNHGDQFTIQTFSYCMQELAKIL